jgi:lysyl endopeptidase
MKQSMKLFYALMLSLGLCFQGNAQVNYGGEPSNWSDKTVSSEIPFIRTSVIDAEALAAEDAVVDQYKEAPYRFGVEHEVHYTPENSGNWSISSHSSMATWQLGIECPGARSINLLFSTYKLPKGAKLFIWSTDREEYLGSFTSENNNENNLLATTVLQSGKIVVEYTLPLEAMGEGQLEIGQIVHGYRPVLMNHFAESVGDRGPYGTSGTCNNNVNCPEGADWQVEKRAVAVILSGGSALCTGALVNNTANDGTPYFLTANHCYSNNVGSWVFVFNHESATCAGTTGPTNQSISGSTLKAKNAGSDFCLLLLNSTPPASYNVEYAGWDASDNPTGNTSVVGIHHPSGDVKKISLGCCSMGRWYYRGWFFWLSIVQSKSPNHRSIVWRWISMQWLG